MYDGSMYLTSAPRMPVFQLVAQPGADIRQDRVAALVGAQAFPHQQLLGVCEQAFIPELMETSIHYLLLPETYFAAPSRTRQLQRE